MSRNLFLVSSNPYPKREPFRPDVWTLHSQTGETVEVQLSENGRRQPRNVVNGIEWILLSEFDRR